MSNESCVLGEVGVKDDLALSINSDDTEDAPVLDPTANEEETLDKNWGRICKWLAVNYPNGDSNSTKTISENLMELMTMGKIKFTFDEAGNDQMSFLSNSEHGSPSPRNTPEPEIVKRSPTPIPQETLNQRYPKAAETRRLLSARTALAHHSFVTEHGRLAQATKISMNFGGSNPFGPINPSKIMDMTNWPGWDIKKIQDEATQWGIDCSELIYLGLVFKNELELSELRGRRTLLKDPRFDMLRFAVQDMGI